MSNPDAFYHDSLVARSLADDLARRAGQVAMSESTIAFIDHLVAQVPVLEPAFREHVSDNFGEVLPHVFFGDLTRYAVSEFLRSEGTSAGARRVSRELESLLAELEVGLDIGGDVTELICASFLENLPKLGEPGDGVRDLLGPKLRSQLNAMG